MKGLFICKKDESIENVSKKSLELSLIAKGDGVEIMLQKIKQGKVIAISPGDDNELMEFYYILNGTISYEMDNTTCYLRTGDYFYVNELESDIFFKSEDDVQMLYVSSQPVFHMLSDEIKELNRISKVVEEKDMYTHVHESRVQDLSIKIAKKMNLSKQKLEGLLFGAVYHDIGKINVPDEILQKTGKLTKEEFEIIKKHPTDGKNFVNNTHLKFTGDIIEQHHERLDGSGYPKGLTDGDILLESKIIAVIDSYDAMTSDRPYRRGMTPQQAIDELKSLAGQHYDKNIVNALESILKEEGIIE